MKYNFIYDISVIVCMIWKLLFYLYFRRPINVTTMRIVYIFKCLCVYFCDSYFLFVDASMQYRFLKIKLNISIYFHPLHQNHVAEHTFHSLWLFLMRVLVILMSMILHVMSENIPLCKYSWICRVWLWYVFFSLFMSSVSKHASHLSIARNLIHLYGCSI